MPVQWVKLEVPLGGMDKLTDAFHTLPGKLHDVINMRFDEPGGLTKRKAMVAIGNETLDSGTVEDGLRLGSNSRGQIVLFGTRQFYSFNGDDFRSWTKRGWYSDTSVERSRVHADAGNSLEQPDYTKNGEIEVISWLGSPSYYVRSVDNGAVLVSGTEQLGRLINVGTKIYSVRGNSTNVQWSRITATSTTASALTFPAHSNFTGAPLTTVAGASRVTGCAVEGSSTSFIIAYAENVSGNLFVERWTDAGTPTRDWQADLGEDADECFEVYADTTNVWVIWGRAGSGVRVNKLAFTNGAAATVSTIAGIGAATGNTRVAIRALSSTRALAIAETMKDVLVEASPPSEQLPVVSWAMVSTTVAIDGPARQHCDLSILARPYLVNEYVYLPVFHMGDGSYGHGFSITIADTSTPQALAAASWRSTFARDLIAGQLSLTDNTLASSTRVPGTYGTGAGGTNAAIVTFPVRIRERFEFAKQNDDSIVRGHTGISLIQITHGASQANWCNWGPGMFIAGGRPSWYDGLQLQEHGFAWPPSVDRDAADDITEVGGGTIANGTYQAQLVFQWQDTQRMIQYSEPSVVMQEEITGGASFLRVAFRNTLLSERRASDSIFTRGAPLSRLQAFRTIEGPGPNFFRATGATGFAIPTSTATVTNVDFGAGTGSSDAEIQNNEVIYTQGGILPNTGTPPADVCLVHQSRLWLGRLEDRHELWFSQPFVETEAPRFNGLLKLRMDEEVTALGSSDERLIVFSADSIRAVSGTGPPAAGGLDLGFNVELLSAKLGQAPPLANTGGHRNVVQCPLGLFFVTGAPEIKLLDRSLTVQNIGDPIKRTLQQDYPFVYCGVHVARDQQVRYLVYGQNGAGVLIYDYRVGEWCRDVFHVSYLPVDMMDYTGATNPAVWHLDSTGHPFREDPDDGVDNEIPYACGFSTPWIKLDTLQGWQRVRSVTLLGRKAQSQADIAMVLYMNYEEDTPVATKLWTFTDINNMAGERLQLKWRLPRQKCQSIKITVAEAFNGDEVGTGAGQHFSSLVFEAGLKKGIFKMGIERKTGTEVVNGVTP